MAIHGRGPTNGASNARGAKKSRFSANISLYLGNDTRYSHSYYRMWIGKQTIEWYHFQWPWTTPNPDFKVTTLFEAEYLRNGTRYRHGYNGILIGTCTRSTKQCNFKWPWVTWQNFKRYKASRGLSATARLLVIIAPHVSTAMLTRDIDIGILSVCPSVRLSRSGIVSKRLNISLYFLQHMVVQSFWFSQ